MKLKLKRSSLTVKLIVLSLAVYSAITLVSLQSQIRARQAEADELAGRVVSARQETARLKNAIENVDTDEGVEKIARAKLGLAIPGEIIFHDVGK